MNTIMRLACYGWVKEDGGSVASAGHAVVAGLLGRGHRLDLFANRQHVPPPAPLAAFDNFDYVGLPPPRSARLGPAPYRCAELLLGPYWRASWRRRYTRGAAARHKGDPYDALLTLGVAPAFVLEGVPTVAWLQGPLQTEAEAIRRLRPLICSVSGRPFYLGLSAYYKLRGYRDRNLLHDCQEVICGSTWSKRAVARGGYPAERLHALPYPIDLQRFQPIPRERRDADGPLLLSVGRLDPRKRLDLLIDAFDLIAPSIPGARLQIVGAPGYAPKQLSLLERAVFRHRITYCPAVPQAEVPNLLNSADVLVQPSENENFGSAVAEAQACGLPVVVGPTNGTADYIDSGSAVFPSYDPKSVADAVVAVLDRVRRDPAGAARAARASAERWFGVDAVVDGLEAALEQARARMDHGHTHT